MLADGPNNLDKGGYWFLIANKSVLETRNIPRKKNDVCCCPGWVHLIPQKGSQQGGAHFPNLSFSTPFMITMDQEIGSQFNTLPLHTAQASFELAIEPSTILNYVPPASISLRLRLQACTTTLSLRQCQGWNPEPQAC